MNVQNQCHGILIQILDRRILCDKAVPICGCCIKARRICTGYGLRLSWPKENDSKRAIVAPPPQSHSESLEIMEMHMINASERDVEVHNYIGGSPLTSIYLAMYNSMVLLTYQGYDNCTLVATKIAWTSPGESEEAETTRLLKHCKYLPHVFVPSLTQFFKFPRKHTFACVQ